jgi:hypothetical protein
MLFVREYEVRRDTDGLYCDVNYCFYWSLSKKVTSTSAVGIPAPQFLDMNKYKLTGKQILALDEESSTRRFPQTNLAT